MGRKGSQTALVEIGKTGFLQELVSGGSLLHLWLAASLGLQQTGRLGHLGPCLSGKKSEGIGRPGLPPSLCLIAASAEAGSNASLAAEMKAPCE